MLLITEAHLEYDAGLVISIGSKGRPSPISQFSAAETLADDLADDRHQLLAMARPPNRCIAGWDSVYPTCWSANGKLSGPSFSVGPLWHHMAKHFGLGLPCQTTALQPLQGH